MNQAGRSRLLQIKGDNVLTVDYEEPIASAFIHLGRPFFVDITSKIFNEDGLFVAQLTQYFRGTSHDDRYSKAFSRQEEYVSYGKRTVFMAIIKMV